MGIPVVALTSGIFGGLIVKSAFRFLDRASPVSVGVLAGGATAILYGITGPILPSLLWVAGGALAGHKFTRDALYKTPQARLMEFEDQIFHQKVLARAKNRIATMEEKLGEFGRLKTELTASSDEAHPDGLDTLLASEQTL